MIATLTTQPRSIPLGHRRHLALGSFWFGLFSIWTPLACDTLPDRGAAAKDLGLFHVAMTLPNSVVTAAAGIALGYLNTLSPLSGYRWVFGTAAIFFLIGTILVSRLKTVR